MSLDLIRDDALSQETLALIGQSEAELASIYPPEVRFAFSPDQLRRDGVVMLRAERGGVPVGCGGVALYEGFGELKRMFVPEAARGTGVVQALLDGLEDIARAAGKPVMRLETGEASPAAIAAYERAGYARRGPFAAYEENGSSVFMEKAL